MQVKTLEPDTIRSLIMLLAAIIGLATAILTIVERRAKELKPSERGAHYRKVLEWANPALSLLGLAAYGVGGRADFFLYPWAMGFAIQSYLFLSSTNSGTIRREVFMLLLSGLAVLFAIMASFIERLTAALHGHTELFRQLVGALSGK